MRRIRSSPPRVVVPDYPDLSRYWKNRRALDHAREEALRHARATVAARCATVEVPGKAQPSSVAEPSPASISAVSPSPEHTQAVEAMHAHHLGFEHLEFFREQILPLIPTLPPGFRALEVGAGMGWVGALLAAHGAGLVLATEVVWGRETPFDLANVHAFHRLAVRDPVLATALTFERNPEGHLISVRLPSTLHFVRAAGERLPVADSSVDFLYAHNCLEHLPDLEGAFDEAARTLRPEGFCFADGMPLFFSIDGHHLADLFPIPWGHLLWEPEALADVVVREVGEGRQWTPGVPLTAAPLVTVLRNELNHAAPAEIRRALRRGPWALEGWVDLFQPEDERLARRIGLHEALHGIPAEALLLRGVRFKLRRTPRPRGLRIPFYLNHRARAAFRRRHPRKKE